MNYINRIPTAAFSVLLFALAFVIRFLNLTATDIAGDEPFSIFVAQLDPEAIMHYLSTGNNPPLFELILHYYMKWVGDSDLLLRLFPTVLSALTVIPIFLIGDRFFNRKVAVTAALLFVLASQHIRFAHEIRVYSLFSLVTAWSLYFFLASIKRPTKITLWMGLILCNVLLMYSHFTSFYIVMIQGITGLILLPKTAWKYLLGSLVLTTLFYSPYLLVFIARLGEVSSAGTWVAKPGFGEIYGSINLMLNHRLTTLVVLIALLLGLLVGSKKSLSQWIVELKPEKSGLTVLAWFTVPYFFMFLLSILFIPLFTDRYILFTSVPLFITVAWMVDLAWRTAKLSWLGSVLIVLGSVATTDLNPQNHRQIKAAVEHVKSLNNSATQVYLCPDFFKLAVVYHYDRTWFGSIVPKQDDNPTSILDSLLFANDIFPVREIEESKLTKSNRVIYLDADSKFVFPENKNLEVFKSQMELVDSSHFHQIFDVYVFERKVVD